jgi:NAD(P)-dependent dehydrogenase (short-subunit alcohol dehydrogenase family)
MDVKDANQVASAIDQIETKFGRVPNIIVNNAAGNFIMASERLSTNAFRTIVDIVLMGTANVTLEVGRRLINAKQGISILNLIQKKNSNLSTSDMFIVYRRYISIDHNNLCTPRRTISIAECSCKGWCREFNA